MDDDNDVGAGSHILASVSRLRKAKKAATMVITPIGPPKTLWGYIYTKHPRPGESKFIIVDEVRFTALILIIVGCVAGEYKQRRGREEVEQRGNLIRGGREDDVMCSERATQ